MAGFVEFFYNIIPGGLFLLAINATFNNFLFNRLQSFSITNDLETISIFVVLSLFSGFAFQMFNKLFEDLFPLYNLKNALKKKYLDDKQVNNYIEAFNRIKNKVKFNELDENFSWLVQLHYCMDVYLRFKETSSLHNYAHARISLWANSTTATSLYAVIVLISSLLPCISARESNLYSLLFVVSLIIFMFCVASTRRSQEIYCDVILKTYLMTTDKKGIVR